jgi:hypothetical protein
LRDKSGAPLRKKAIHTYGSVARIHLVPDTKANHPYTGIFRSGALYGLIRVSLAIKPSSQGVTPGAALKFYVDRPAGSGGTRFRSLNVHVMHKLDPTSGYNVFAEPYSNLLPPPISPELIAGSEYFKAGLFVLGALDLFPGHLSVDHLAKFTADGNQESNPRFPYRITFVPSNEAKQLMAQATLRTDFRAELPRLAAGTKLFDLYADETKTYHAYPYGAHVGEVILDSEFVASRYGDEILHFMHHTALKH